ncbi:hypothetical protein BGZ76_010940, partial [Entomortierella beljakovae]
IDRILTDSEYLNDDQDDLAFLDDIDTLNPTQTQELKNAISTENQKSGKQELDNVTQDLENTLSRFLQTHHPSPSTPSSLDNHNSTTTDLGSIYLAKESDPEKAFGNQFDRITGVSYSSSLGGDDEASRLINQAREAAHLEAKYGSNEDSQIRDLNSRHEELKKGMQNLSSIRPTTSSQPDKSSKSTDEGLGLGPPPSAVNLDELRLGTGGSGDDIDENPDNWCCVCNEDATWTCSGCDNDNYCEGCFRESHIGPDADWEMKKHRPRPFVKGVMK